GREDGLALGQQGHPFIDALEDERDPPPSPRLVDQLERRAGVEEGQLAQAFDDEARVEPEAGGDGPPDRNRGAEGVYGERPARVDGHREAPATAIRLHTPPSPAPDSPGDSRGQGITISVEARRMGPGPHPTTSQRSSDRQLRPEERLELYQVLLVAG